MVVKRLSLFPSSFARATIGSPRGLPSRFGRRNFTCAVITLETIYGKRRIQST
jgi:hypothetical protein